MILNEEQEFMNILAKLFSTFIIACVISVPVYAKQNEVVVYTSVDDVFARPVAEAFEKKSGIKVRLVTDTEETKSTGLLNRLIAEKNRPRADLFWSGDPVRSAILKQKDITEAYKSPNSKGLPELYSDPEGYWTGFSARARVLLYNKNAFPEDKKPASIMDLINPEYKAKGGIANPLFGTTSMHAAALFEVLGEKQAKAFFEALTKNKVRMVSSNGEIKRLVSQGDLAFGITDTDDANEAIKDGKPVGVIYPDKDGIGTLIIPNAVSLIKKAPNPKSARLFIDYLLTAETERALALSAAQMPVRVGVSTPPGVKRLEEIVPMKVDYTKIAEHLDKLSHGFLKTWAQQNQR
jgi:iron(III) transport system substrate-binding protein